MITGGTDSFRLTVLKHFLDSDLKEIRIFSRDENEQDGICHELQAKLRSMSKKVKFYIGDVRNPQFVRDATFHAATLKQVPSCEFFPYDKYVVKSQVHTMADESYTSYNTNRLDVEGTVKKIFTTDYVKEVLAHWEASKAGTSLSRAQRAWWDRPS